MGGNLLNTGPHPLDQALQLFGSEGMPEVTCFMRRAVTCGDAEDHVLLILSGEGRPLLQVEISSCCKYPGATYTVYGTRGGLTGDTGRLEWQYFDPAAAPALQLTTAPIQKPDGTPAYCSDSLAWRREEWLAPEGQGLFETMAAAFYSMLYRTLTEGAPLEITPQQVRQQIAVIEAAQRQNPHIYPGRGNARRAMAFVPALRGVGALATAQREREQPGPVRFRDVWGTTIDRGSVAHCSTLC